MLERIWLYRDAEGASGGAAPSAGTSDHAAAAAKVGTASLLDAPAAATGAGAGEAAAAAKTAEKQATTAKWYEGLGEALRGNPELHQFGSPDELAQAYLGAKGLLGKDPARLVELPADEASERALFAKLGLPEKVEDYKLESVKDAGEFGDANGEVGKAFREAAHRLGILPKQAQALFGELGMLLHGAQEKIAADNAAASTAAIGALKGEWGQAFDAKVADARAAAQQFGVVEALNNAGLGAHPGVIKLLAALGEKLQEGQAGPPGGRGGNGRLTPEQARQRAYDLQAQAMAATDRATKERLAREASGFFKIAHGA